MYQDRISKLPDYALGFNLALVGHPGSGKTSAIVMAIKCGMEVFVLFSEANGPSNFLKAARDIYKLNEEEMSRLHFCYLKSGVTKFKTLRDTADIVNKAPEFGKISGGSRSNYDQLVKLMAACVKFVDQNGKEFGAVDEWGPNRLIALDSLTGLNDMAMQLTIGGKPCPTQQDWGVAMKQEMDLIKALIGTQACFLLTAHLSLEKDEVSGRLITAPMALGQKNGPAMLPLFSDIVLAEKEGDKFYWSTTNSKIDCLKNSFLPLKAKMSVSMDVLIDQWLKANGV